MENVAERPHKYVRTWEDPSWHVSTGNCIGFGDDGRVYENKRSPRSIAYWHVDTLRSGQDYSRSVRYVRRDRLNDPQKIEALRWRLLAHIHGRSLLRYRSIFKRIETAPGSEAFFLEADGNWERLLVEQGTMSRERIKAPGDAVSQIASIPVDKKKIALGHEYRVVSSALDRAWHHLHYIDTVLTMVFDLHLNRLLPDFNKYDRTKPRHAFIVNGRRYDISRDRQTSAWPCTSDQMINLDDSANKLAVSKIHWEHRWG